MSQFATVVLFSAVMFGGIALLTYKYREEAVPRVLLTMVVIMALASIFYDPDPSFTNSEYGQGPSDQR